MIRDLCAFAAMALFVAAIHAWLPILATVLH